MNEYNKLSVVQKSLVYAHIVADLYRNEKVDPSKRNVGFTDAFLQYVRETHHFENSTNSKAVIESAFQAVLGELRDSYANGIDTLGPIKSGNVSVRQGKPVEVLRAVLSAVEMDHATPETIKNTIERTVAENKDSILSVKSTSLFVHTALNGMLSGAAKMQSDHLVETYGFDIANAVKSIPTTLGDHREAKLLATAIEVLNKKPEGTFANFFGNDDRTPAAIAAVTKALNNAGVDYNTNDVTTIVTAANRIKDNVRTH